MVYSVCCLVFVILSLSFFSNSRIVCVFAFVFTFAFVFLQRFCLPTIFTVVVASASLICWWTTAQQAATMCFDSFSLFAPFPPSHSSGKGGKWCRCCGFCYAMLCGNSSNLVERVKDVKQNESMHTVEVRARAFGRKRVLHKREYIIYKCDSLSNHLLHSHFSLTLYGLSSFVVLFFLIRPSPSLEWHTRGFQVFLLVYCFMHTLRVA